MFGGMFDDTVSPPLGSWVALKFAQIIDPAITYEIYSDRPWILSPVFCSMNIVDARDAKYTWKQLEEKFEGCKSVVDQVVPEGQGIARPETPLSG